MKIKAIHTFSVMQGDTCHSESTFPNQLLVFFLGNGFNSESGPLQPQQIFLYSLQWRRLVEFAGARACKWMVPKWWKA